MTPRLAASRNAVLVGVALLVAAGIASWWLSSPRAAPRSPASVVRAPEFLHAAAVVLPDMEDRGPEALHTPEPGKAAGPIFEVDVVDAEGKPVRGARVTCSGGAGLSGLTDEIGRARLHGDPFAGAAWGDISVTASALCYRSTTQPIGRPGATESTPRADSPAPSSAPTRLVLRRCALLKLVLVPGEDVDVLDLFIRLSSDGKLFEAGLPPGTTGAIGGQRPKSFDWFPHLSATEPGISPENRDAEDESDGADTRGEERMYDFSTEGTRLIVGLQPGQPLHVRVAAPYGETVFEQVLTLAPEEWRELETPVFLRKRTLTIVVRDSDGALVADPQAMLMIGWKTFDSLATVFGTHPAPGVVEFAGLRAEHLGVHVFSEGFLPLELSEVSLEQGDTIIEVVLQRAIAVMPSR